MSYGYDLLHDEAEIRAIDDVSCCLESSNGLAKLLDASSKVGSLILTNQRILFCWEEGTFRKRQQVLSVPLADIRSFNGELQIKIKPPKKARWPFPAGRVQKRPGE